MSCRTVLLLSVFLMFGGPAAHADISTYTDSASFFAAATGAVTETFETLPLGLTINSGDTVHGITYLAFPSSTCGMVGNTFNTIDSQALELSCGQDFFFPGDSLIVQFASPVTAVGIFFNAGDHPFGPMFIQTDQGTAFDNNIPEFSSFYFAGLVSDTPFLTATFGSDPNGSAFTLDDLSYAPVTATPEPNESVALVACLLAVFLRRRRSRALPVFVFAALLAGSHLHAQNTTAVTILKPLNGATLNVATLDVQALVSDFVAAPPGANLLTYWHQMNATAGRLTRAELRLDGTLVQTRTIQTCLRQDLVTFTLTNLTAGTHTLQVTAYQHQGTGEVSKAVSISFTLDPTVNPPQSNPIEHAATPQPFGCLQLAGFDADAGPALQPGIPGRLRLGDNSDGLDLAADRVAIDIGATKTLLEPGSFACNSGVCSFADNFQPVIRSAQFAAQPDGSWTFLLQGNIPVNPASFYLRIGNDWGGRLLTTGEYVTRLRTTLDATHRSQATIGAAGGSLQAVNASGVKIRLDIPAGALTRNTAITLSALTGSPLVNPPNPLDVGVQFDPEGLQFSTPATLTFDFSATGKFLSGSESLYLMTAPGTKVPLYGSVDLVNRTVTAHIWHFSDMAPDSATAAFEDLKPWADAFLGAVNGNVTLQSLEASAALAADEQKAGCTQNCVDLAGLGAGVETAITNLVAAACPADIASPTDLALRRYLELEALAQGFGESVPTLRPCYKLILEGLINQASTTAASSAPDDPTLNRLTTLGGEANALGFDDLYALAVQKLAQALIDLQNRLTAAAHSADGTAGEDQAHQQGIDFLTLEKVWITPAVSGVAPDLAGQIQQDIDGLRGGITSVTIWADHNGARTYNTCQFSARINSPGQIQDATLGGIFNDLMGVDFGHDQVPPASLLAQEPSCRAGSTLTRPSQNIIALDIDVMGDCCVSFGGVSGFWQVQIFLEVKTSGSVILRADADPFIWAGYPDGFSYNSGSVLANQIDPAQGLGPNELLPLGATTGSITIGPGTTLVVIVVAGFQYPSSFKGRILTLTATPVQ